MSSRALDWVSKGNLTAAQCDAIKGGIPLMVVDLASLVEKYDALKEGFALESNVVISPVMKALPDNNEIISTLQQQGATFTVFNSHELTRALEAGTPPDKIIYSPPFPLEPEIKDALAQGITYFSIATAERVDYLDRSATELGIDPKTLNISARIKINSSDPRVEQDPAVARFGVPDGIAILETIKDRGFTPYGVHFHIDDFMREQHIRQEALAAAAAIFDEMQDKHGVALKMLDLGGGWPVDKDAIRQLNQALSDEIKASFTTPPETLVVACGGPFKDAAIVVGVVAHTAMDPEDPSHSTVAITAGPKAAGTKDPGYEISVLQGELNPGTKLRPLVPHEVLDAEAGLSLVQLMDWRTDVFGRTPAGAEDRVSLGAQEYRLPAATKTGDIVVIGQTLAYTQNLTEPGFAGSLPQIFTLAASNRPTRS